MFVVNKIVWMLANPATVGVLLILFAGLFRKWWCVFLGLVWVWAWSVSLTMWFMGVALEAPFANQRLMQAEDFPQADAIADLGGGTGFNTNMFAYVQLSGSADRALQSARLWKAGRAPVVIPSGSGCCHSDAAFLRELGIPAEAIVVENEARNTEENARYVERLVLARRTTAPVRTDGKPRVLVVTSAWHMRRSLQMFEKYASGIDVIPVACDFECGPHWTLSLRDFIPNFETAGHNAVYFHEWLGILGYKYLMR